VVSASDLRTVPSADLNDKVMQTVPSYNVQRMPLADGAIFNRPATLRGLAPDQTLVLVNGKRRHRSAYIDVTAQGAQAVDMAELPLAAIARVEVLRDGASAQYGSDAIAGVVTSSSRTSPATMPTCSTAATTKATATATSQASTRAGSSAVAATST
jgi:iron complex outermembrane receptor protein